METVLRVNGLTAASLVLGMIRLLLSLGVILCVAPSFAADNLDCEQMIRLAASGKPGLKEAVLTNFSEDALKGGRQFLFHAGDFFFAVESDAQPSLVIDEDAPRAMNRLKDTKIWYAAVTGLRVSFDHRFHYVLNGKNFGGAEDLPALGPLSYVQPGVLSGTLSDLITVVSKVYPGMVSTYRVYVPAQYDPKVPAALMVFQDGESFVHREGMAPVLSVIDNLIAMKKIPVMIGVFVNPGDISGALQSPDYAFIQRYMKENGGHLNGDFRSEEYDSVTDRYNRYLHDEILAELKKKYNVREDAYSRATMGISSGGICAFNTAWFRPDEFSRVISWVGSFGAHQWKEVPGDLDGGQDYPEKILREPHRNIRVWLADGSNDLEQRDGSWPLNNIRMANALKMAGYDFHFSFGTGEHSAAYGGTQLSEEMIWLWRDYDPAKTSQVYEMEPGEKAKPLFRVSITNRDAN
jgi:enterochelin esterase-like enzyme